jgi:hypothetical protein
MLIELRARKARIIFMRRPEKKHSLRKRSTDPDNHLHGMKPTSLSQQIQSPPPTL